MIEISYLLQLLNLKKINYKNDKIVIIKTSEILIVYMFRGVGFNREGVKC